MQKQITKKKKPPKPQNPNQKPDIQDICLSHKFKKQWIYNLREKKHHQYECSHYQLLYSLIIM